VQPPHDHRPRWTAASGLFAGLALLAAAVILGKAGHRAGEVSTLPTVANLGPRGLAAAHELLRSMGATAIRRGPGQPAVAGAAVVVLAAPAAALVREDVASLTAEATGGATVLIALGSTPQPALAEALGFELTPGAAPRLARGLAPHRLVGDLSLPGRSAALSPTRPGGLGVSGDRGWTSALSIPVGRGEVLVLSGPEPLENANLVQGDAATLLVRLGALGPVVFDERFLVAPRPAAPPSWRALLLLAAQLLLAGTALVLARGRRLGAIRPPLAAGAGRSARDYLASLAALYQRAGAEQELAAQAWRGLRRRLERRWGIPARLADAQAARRVAGRSPEAAVALARGSAALAGGGDGILLRVTRAAAEAEAALGGRRRASWVSPPPDRLA
jgi:hypothetical protein